MIKKFVTHTIRRFRLLNIMLTSFLTVFRVQTVKIIFTGKQKIQTGQRVFWTGELWLAYESNKDDKLKEAALCQVDNFLYRIEHHINTDHHDMGFLYSPSCVAAYKLTGSEVGKRAALLAADNLMKRFHEKGQFFQAWGKIGDKDD